jgi:phosphoribosyl-ATP pyrophosphohydrolase
LAKQETADILEALFTVIEKRRSADPDASYTARLFARGLNKIAQKLGEEATETVIAALAEDRKRLVSESADLIYHLLVLWAARDVKPAEVFTELAARRQPQAKRAL